MSKKKIKWNHIWLQQHLQCLNSVLYSEIQFFALHVAADFIAGIKVSYSAGDISIKRLQDGLEKKMQNQWVGQQKHWWQSVPVLG